MAGNVPAAHGPNSFNPSARTSQNVRLAELFLLDLFGLIAGRGFRSPPGSATALGRNYAQTPRQENENETDYEKENDWPGSAGGPPAKFAI